MKYQTMPPLSEEDATALEKSIRTHGIQVPVLVDEESTIIDGHHRWEIGTRCGIPVPTETREGLTEAQKVALSISLNKDRRQLSSAQKREIIAASLKAEPEASNREHARRTGADDKTVQAVRSDLESGAEIPHLEERTNPQGRTQPASKPERPVVSIKTKETVETTETFDAQTGEAIENVRAALDADLVSDDKREAAERFVQSDQRVKNSGYMRAFYKALSMEWSKFDAERIAQLSTDADVRTVELFAKSATEFYEKVRRARSGLRLVEGGKK